MLNIFYKNNYMKTLTKLSFFILAVFFAATSGLAQSDLTADQIVAKNIEAIGGRDLLNGIKSVVIESSVDVDGNEATTKTTILNGKGFKNETEFNGTKIVNCITPTSGWDINPFLGHTVATAMTDDAVKQAQAQLHVGGPLMDYSANGGKIELIGKDTADYKIHLTNSVGTDVTFYINMKTFLVDMIVAKLNMGGQDVETTEHFSDYRKTDGGPLMAYSQTRELPQYTLNITHKKIDINQDIDPTIFDMPK